MSDTKSVAACCRRRLCCILLRAAASAPAKKPKKKKKASGGGGGAGGSRSRFLVFDDMPLRAPLDQAGYLDLLPQMMVTAGPAVVKLIAKVVAVDCKLRWLGWRTTWFESWST